MAYAELAELVGQLGLDLVEMDSSAITCVSVETDGGPGFLVSVRHQIDDNPTEEQGVS
jgi:hypothetical protein